MTKEKFLSRTPKNENQFTADTFMYINNNYPKLRGMFFHVPNESATSDLMRVKLASMGVLPGVPDFCFLLPYEWWMELKIPGGSLSPAQNKLHERWKSYGKIVTIAWTAIDVISLCDQHLSCCKDR